MNINNLKDNLKTKIQNIVVSKELRVAAFFFFYFVMTSLVETITEFYEIKSTIVHSYSVWIMVFLFFIAILPTKASNL